MTLDQYFLCDVIHKNLNSSKSEISQWYLVAFFSGKMISAETKYKTHSLKVLTIVEVSRLSATI